MLRNVPHVNNVGTYNMYVRQLLTIAENFGIFEDLPSIIDESFINKKLVRQGEIAFFVDEVLGLLALPFYNLANLDLYNRPTKILCYGLNGYQSRPLRRGEFVIMYDNETRFPLLDTCCQYAVRLANITRSKDINISQQKTPRIFQTRKEQEYTTKNIINQIDKNSDIVLGYDNIDLEGLSMILAPAPFVADKLSMEFRNTFNEFLNVVGVYNSDLDKKERLISGEIENSQSRTTVFVNNRLLPRQRALKQIKELFGYDITFNHLAINEVNNYGILYNDLTDDNGESSGTDNA